MDESALIEAAQDGDRAAFEQLLKYVMTVFIALLLDGPEIRPMLKILRKWPASKLARGVKQFQFGSAFSTYLYRLVINCARDWQRQQLKQGDQFKNLAGEMTNDPVTEDSSETSVFLRQVLQMVDQFGKEYKETLVLVFGEGLSHSEAAVVLKVKESTISWRIHEIRKKLSLLDSEEGGH